MSLNSDLLRTRLNELEISLDVFTALSSIPSSTLSLSLRGTKDLSVERFRGAIALLDELRELAARYKPAPLAWKNTVAIRELLETQRSAKHLKTPASVDPFELLHELAPGSIDQICAMHNWSRTELIKQIAAASRHLHELQDAIAPVDTDSVGGA